MKRQGIIFPIYLENGGKEGWCSHCFRDLLNSVEDPPTLLYVSGKNTVIGDAHCDCCHESVASAKAEKATSALLKDIKEGRYA